MQKDFEAAARTRTDWGLHAEIELRLDTRECVPYSFCKRFHFSRSETKGWGLGLFAFIRLLILAPIQLTRALGTILVKARDAAGAVIFREKKLTNTRQTQFALKYVF